MKQAQMNMSLTKKGLETVRVNNVTRDLVKNAFDAIKLPCSTSRQKTPLIVGEEALSFNQ